ncbi:MAG: hypothetical protein R2771_14995 [Saprospiraceae bacterium]
MDMATMHSMANENNVKNDNKYISKSIGSTSSRKIYLLKVDEGQREYWIATEKTNAKPGNTYVSGRIIKN